MSDPYAEALGIKAPEESSTKISPALQKSRDGDAVDILHTERDRLQKLLEGSTTDELRVRYKSDVDSSAREIKALGGTPKVYAALAPLKDPYAAALGVDGPMQPTQPSAAPGAIPVNAQAKPSPLTSNVAQTLPQSLPIPGVKLGSMLAQRYMPEIVNRNVDTSSLSDFGKRLGAGAVSLGDTVANGVGGMVKQAEYAGRRAFGNSPEEATKRSNEGVGAYLENPVSKFVNSAGKLLTGTDPKIQDTAGYKGEASQKAMQFIGENIGKGADWLSGKTGLPKADVENMMNTAVLGVTPAVGKYAGKVVQKTAGTLDGLNQELAGRKPLSSMLDAGKPDAPVLKPSYKLINGRPVLISQDMSIPAITPAIDSAKPGGSALATPAVTMPKSAESIKQLAENNPAGLFPEIPTHAPAGERFTPAEQAARAQTMVDVGIDPSRLRKSAVTGDHLSGSTDHQTSRVDNPAGRIMRNDLDQEKLAISNSALQISRDAGGTTGLNQTQRESRGNSIIEPINEFRKYLDEKTSALYKEKDAIAQGIPTDLTSLVRELNTKSNILGHDDTFLKDSVRSYADEIGMLKPDGSISGSVLQAEKLRQHLNKSYKYENSTLNVKLKEAIDNDTFTPEDGTIYKDARALRTYRANTLDNPNGISKLAESSGPDGINRKVQIEGIPKHLVSLPVAQFRHIVDTLRSMPPELSSLSGKSLAEIKSHFANLYHEAGTSDVNQWNAKNATTFLQANASHMAHLFRPDEMAQFRKINDAGHITAKGQDYPGAAAQKHNLVTNGLMASTTAAGTGIGYMAGDVTGGAIGTFLGGQLASKIGDASAVRAVNKRMVKLSDLVNTK